MNKCSGWITRRLWYGRHPLANLLRPLSVVFGVLVKFRRALYQSGLKRRCTSPVPVIVVGNITVGGTGKTPLVIWLARMLAGKGYRPGIVTRGYGTQGRGSAGLWAEPSSDPHQVGDEPLLISRSSGCPVRVDRKRCRAIAALTEEKQCDVILSDDGLQHYAMNRDIEIAVIDGERRFGNGFLLPAGPLREPVQRLDSVDFKVASGAELPGAVFMEYRVREAKSLNDPDTEVLLESFGGKTVYAVAGIGHADRFFRALREFGISVVPIEFPDHHDFVPEDLCFDQPHPVLMTEKDAIKVDEFAGPDFWKVPLEVELPENFADHLISGLNDRYNDQPGLK